MEYEYSSQDCKDSIAYLQPDRKKAQEIKEMNANFKFQYQSMMEAIPDDIGRIKNYLVRLWLRVEELENKVERLGKQG